MQKDSCHHAAFLGNKMFGIEVALYRLWCSFDDFVGGKGLPSFMPGTTFLQRLLHSDPYRRRVSRSATTGGAFLQLLWPAAVRRQTSPNFNQLAGRKRRLRPEFNGGNRNPPPARQVRRRSQRALYSLVRRKRRRKQHSAGGWRCDTGYPAGRLARRKPFHQVAQKTAPGAENGIGAFERNARFSGKLEFGVEKHPVPPPSVSCPVGNKFTVE